MRSKGDRLCIIAAAEKFLQPYIQTNEQVTASHFPDLELCFSCSSVAPRNWNDRPGIASHNRFEGNFDREIEMRRDERSTPVDHRLSISLKRVRGVVQPNAEK